MNAMTSSANFFAFRSGENKKLWDAADSSYHWLAGGGLLIFAEASGFFAPTDIYHSSSQGAVSECYLHGIDWGVICRGRVGG